MKRLLLLVCILSIHTFLTAQPFYTGFTTYTPDGLFSPNATPIGIWTPNGESRTLIGYEDYGSGQYVPRIGFLQPVSPYMPGAKNSIGNVLNGSLTVNVGQNNEERFRITPAGHVGIGVVPSTNLHVALQSTTNTITKQSDLSGYLHLSDYNSSLLNTKTGLIASFQSSPGIASGVIFGRYGSTWGTYIGFHTHADNAGALDDFTEKMRIDGSGNVGIGTIAPQGKLDIFNESNTTLTPLLSIRSDFHTPGNYGMIRFGDYTQTSQYQKGAIIYESVAGSARGKFHIALENTDSNGSVALADAKLTVLSNGHVGIGTTIPSEMLSVNGKIRAREIKVENINWPDYVFESSHKLLDLKATEQFIKENNHLPEIPSAAEVAKDGVSLGEMNALLLKKIEELTLHLIEQNKRLDEQQEEIRKLKSKR